MADSLHGMVPTSSAAVKDLDISVLDGRVTLDVENADLSKVIQEISRQAGIQITLDNGIGGKISIRSANRTIEETLKFLCNSHALVYEYLPSSKTYRVIRADVIAGQNREERELNSSTVKAAAESTSMTRTRSDLDEYTPGDIQKQIAEVTTDSRGWPMYKTSELLIRFKKGVDDSQIEAFHHSLGSRVVHRIARTGIQQVKIRDGWSETEAIDAYLASGMVEHVERHALRYAKDTMPDDPYNDQSWWIKKADIHRAWDITSGNSEVLIAVIDTGVDYYHPDLKDNIDVNSGEIHWNGIDDDGNGYTDDIYGWDVAGNQAGLQDSDKDPMDVDGHGTHVSGIIAAVGNNGRGIAGVNWSTRILPIKVQADDANFFEDADVIEALYYARDRGVHIVNCSFGGSSFSQLEFDAFEDLRQSGILAVCAAGNDSKDTDAIPNYPSAYNLDNIIAVAAGDSGDNLASYSNFGAESVDVMAPGSSIKSTVPVNDLTEASVSAGDGSLTVAAQGMTHAGLTAENGIPGLLIDCNDGNQQGDFPPSVNGNIALIERGIETFETKTRNAINAGAIGAVIYNNVYGSFLGTLGTPDNWIPVVSVSDTDGQNLLGIAGKHGGADQQDDRQGRKLWLQEWDIYGRSPCYRYCRLDTLRQAEYGIRRHQVHDNGYGG